ncbi:hypothetical protein BST91_03250 [Nonlabens tegetincola]|uniref:hypothetical protein n=1 Tax=Nonlabens tegetincola TaxID=323273 RepID=UPI000A202778|nr:hypothetical protein [Nonlabens tegetincola]ARN70732.1 hypothetical protein BST91_03250 [Nonlabens tegetincola]
MKYSILLILFFSIISCHQDETLSLDYNNEQKDFYTSSKSVYLFTTEQEHREFLKFNSWLIISFIKKHPVHLQHFQNMINPVDHTLSMHLLYDETINVNFSKDFKNF